MSFTGDYGVSYVTFGGYDLQSFAKEELTWHNNVSDWFWAVNLTEIKTGSETLMSNDYGRELIVDSGSSYILLPRTDFNAFLDQMQEVARCRLDWWDQVSCSINSDE